MTVHDALAIFLRQTGRLQDYETLGDREEAALPVTAHLDALVSNLRRRQRTSDTMMWVLTGLHVALFTACVFVGIAYASDSSIVTVLLGGGSLVGILKIVTSLKETWRDKVLSDVVVEVAPSLPPREFVTLVETIYHGDASRAGRSIAREAEARP